MTDTSYFYAEECKELSKVVYQNGEGIVPANWTKILQYDSFDPETNTKTGYYGEAYTDGSTVIIVSRGTEPLAGTSDLYNDLQMAIDKVPDQLGDLNAFYGQLEREGYLSGKEVIFAGHSMGGSLSQLGAAIHEAEAITFNAYGTQSLIADVNNTNNISLSTDPEAYKDTIVNYVVETDMTGNAGKQLGTSFYISGPQQNETLEQFINEVVLSLSSSAFVPGIAMPFRPLLEEIEYHVLLSHSLDNFDNYNLEDPQNNPYIFNNQSPSAKIFTDLAEFFGGYTKFNLELPSSIPNLIRFLLFKGVIQQQQFLQSNTWINDTILSASDVLIKALSFLAMPHSGLNPLLKSIQSLFSQAKNTISPLVLDLDGDGIETTAVNTGTYFDHNANGFAALLELDSNSNGKIDSSDAQFVNLKVLKGDGTNYKKAA